MPPRNKLGRWLPRFTCHWHMLEVGERVTIRMPLEVAGDGLVGRF